jgi:hypothetical protein
LRNCSSLALSKKRSEYEFLGLMVVSLSIILIVGGAFLPEQLIRKVENVIKPTKKKDVKKKILLANGVFIKTYRDQGLETNSWSRMQNYNYLAG